MAQRDRADIHRALCKKGFQNGGGDHEFYYYEKNQAIFTKLSRGSNYKVYGDSLLGKMKFQLKLTKQELLDLIDCTIDSDAYKKKLIDQELIADDEVTESDDSEE